MVLVVAAPWPYLGHLKNFLIDWLIELVFSCNSWWKQLHWRTAANYRDARQQLHSLVTRRHSNMEEKYQILTGLSVHVACTQPVSRLLIWWLLGGCSYNYIQDVIHTFRLRAVATCHLRYHKRSLARHFRFAFIYIATKSVRGNMINTLSDT